MAAKTIAQIGDAYALTAKKDGTNV